MKAVLVIDMPQNCGKCPISEYILFENGKARADLGGNCPIANNYIEKWNERPSWCPLKPMPSRKNNHESEMVGCLQMDIGYTLGWNDFLDEIVGKDCRDCTNWETCACGKTGHEKGTSQGYSIGECQYFEKVESSNESNTCD